MLHVIEIATGRIVEVCAEGSDVSRFKDPDYLIVKDAAVHDMQTERWNLETKVFVSISESDKLAALKKMQYAKLSDDYAAYVSSRGYKLSWQNFGRSIIDKCQDVIDSTTATDEQKTAAAGIISKLRALDKWLTVDLAKYFFTKGSAIHSATTIDEVLAITWDFTQFDADDPKVTMGRDILPVLFGKVLTT